jgi:hypothetical protein
MDNTVMFPNAMYALCNFKGELLNGEVQASSGRQCIKGKPQISL